MEHLIEHRAFPRRSIRLDVVADYVPHGSSGRWWENFEVRTTDIGAGGLQLMSTVPVEVGARVRLIAEPGQAHDLPRPCEGTIVWVSKPAIPWLGIYRAGVTYQRGRVADHTQVEARIESALAAAA